ncbi:hypothetical protein [Leifsonia sp. fls2-241-R2A-40a]|uniref:hypothetical protein n=1 Tax=Leifsonia sp. fls2-241-R2A-40a TaxID=3040290 RepID=UPI00254EBA43|nr:hypothetical protein [Leifsonia sp. fls2-241-R2A-40a]
MRGLILHAVAPEGSFLGVDWGSFVVVSLVAFVATSVVVVSYALALRLLAVGAPLDAEGGAVSVRDGRRPAVATVGAVVCFAIGVAAVLYGIWLIVPQFH